MVTAASWLYLAAPIAPVRVEGASELAILFSMFAFDGKQHTEISVSERGQKCIIKDIR